MTTELGREQNARLTVGFLRESFSRETYLAWLVPARIVVGYHFILVAWPKVFRGFPPEALAKQLLENAPRNPIALHRDFIVGFVVPNVDFFSPLIAYGEMAIGLSLVTGCLVRIAAGFAFLHNANIFLAVAVPNASAQIPWNFTLLFMHLVFAAAGARSLPWHRRMAQAEIPAKSGVLMRGAASMITTRGTSAAA